MKKTHLGFVVLWARHAETSYKAGMFFGYLKVLFFAFALETIEKIKRNRGQKRTNYQCPDIKLKLCHLSESVNITSNR